MGVSIKLYRISKANDLNEVADLVTELKDAEENQVDLYKVSHDISMVLQNEIDPYPDENTIANKVLFGKRIERQIGHRHCIGFIPTNEVKPINEWIVKQGINTEAGFAKIYADLDALVKQELIDLCSPDKSELFKGYIERLVLFYKKAEANENAVIICAE